MAPIVWFAGVSLVAATLGAGTLYWMEGRIGRGGAAKSAYVAASGIGATGLVVFAHAPTAASAVVGSLLVRGVGLPTIRVASTILVNRRTTSDARATVHSLLSQAENLGEIVFGLLLAAIVTTTSPTITLIGSALLVALAGATVSAAPDPHASSRTSRRPSERSRSPRRARTSRAAGSDASPAYGTCEPLVVHAFESVSTWRPSRPAAASGPRRALLAALADEVCALGTGRLRVAIDGRTGAGKSTFGVELAEAIGERGRPTMRASLDDFKRPWRDAVARGYDRTSGEGYYRNAPDFESARTLLLEPAGRDGSGSVALCGHDPLTGADHRHVRVTAPPDAVLVVDSVFALRPEYRDAWDLTVWLEVDEDTSLRRALARDAARDGAEEVERVHRERYAAAEAIYLAEVDPVAQADVVIDNHDVHRPRRLR